jgi:hypothetical protein
MKCNVSKTGQVVRLIFGTILTSWAFAGGPPWTWVGVALAATGAWRLCPIYMALGIRPQGIEAKRQQDS